MVGGNRQAHAEMTKSIACWLDIDGHLRTDIFFPEIYRLHDSMLPETKDKWEQFFLLLVRARNDPKIRSLTFFLFRLERFGFLGRFFVI